MSSSTMNGSVRSHRSSTSLLSKLLRRPPIPLAPSSKKNKAGTNQAIMNLTTKHVPRTSSTLSSVRHSMRKARSRHSSGGSVSKPRGTNSLFRAISSENWDLVVELCDAKPYKAKSWHAAPGFFDAHRSSTILPLHQACVFHPPRIALSRLIRAYPHATSAKESGYGRVPLHIACHSSASMDAIQALLQQNPSSSFDQDNLGRVPLHYALSNGSTPELVRELLISANEAGGTQGLIGCTSATDFNGWLPLHVACHMCAPLETIRLLVQVYPDAVQKKTKKKSTPLDLIRSLSVPAAKRARMEAVLNRTEEHPPPKDDLKRHPCDIENLHEIGTESVTGSKQLQIDLNDDASSLSSMDTAQTGLSRSRSNLSLTAEQKQTKKKNDTCLPTHRAYSELLEPNNSKSVISLPSDGYALGAGHVVVRKKSINRLGSMHSKEIAIRNSHSSSTNTHGDEQDDEEVSHSFQSVTPTAVFC